MFRLLHIAEFQEDQHPRGQPENSGEFAPKKGPSGPSERGGQAPGSDYPRMPSDLYNETPRDLQDRVAKAGGFTYQPLNKDSPQIGDKVFSVAYSKNTEKVVPEAQFNSQSLYEYLQEHWGELKDPRIYFGAWKEGGNIYLDCSMVLSDEAKAVQLAQDNDQLAYFKFEDASTVETPKKSQATIKKLLIDSNRTAAAHLAEVNSALKIDDLIALTQKLTGRRASPQEIARLERTMGQKASDV